MIGKLLEHKITLIVGIVLLAGAVLIGGYFALRPHNAGYATVPAQTRTIQEIVTADGSIDSDDHVSLSFRNAGTVASVAVAVGDPVTEGETLAVLDTSDLEAQLAGAQADVLAAQAGLTSLQNGATPQTLAIYNTSIVTAQAALATAVPDAFLKAEDAVLNKSDLLFNGGTSANPEIAIQTDSPADGLVLDEQRVEITGLLNTWKNDIAGAPSSESLIAESSNDLSVIKSFLDAMTAQANRLTANNSGLTQSQISGYVGDENVAESEVNAAQTEFNAAVNGLEAASAQQAQVQASSTVETIQGGQAAVAKAQADVQLIQSEIGDATIVAPFSGTVASVNVKAGEAVAAADPAIDIVSTGNYKMDVYVPENEVGLIEVGDPAILTFDAYGSDLTATATVASIDLSETVTDGVGAYKTTLVLGDPDPRIRIGMTANAAITGSPAENVLSVPTSAILTGGSGQFVLVKQPNGSFDQTAVMTDASGGGWTEIVSGLSGGEAVAAFGDASDQ